MNFSKQPKIADSILQPQTTLNETIQSNPELTHQTFEGIGYVRPDEFSNQHATGASELMSNWAGFKDLESGRQISTNAVALVIQTAKAHNLQIEGLSGFDDLIDENGEPVSAEKVDEIINPYLENNPSVAIFVEEYTGRVDPDQLNPEATRRAIVTAAYLVDETLKIQAEDMADEQAGYDQVFDQLVSPGHMSVDGVREENYLPTQEEFDKRFAELVDLPADGVEIDPHERNENNKRPVLAFTRIGSAVIKASANRLEDAAKRRQEFNKKAWDELDRLAETYRPSSES